jgi:CubicO group peptidase (beta-lactamase class C family)
VELERVEAEIAARSARDEFSGAVLITRDGVDLLAGCWGAANRADGIPVTRNTRFGLASLSKTFTAVAIGRLVDAGSVEFATPVIDCLPPDARPRDLDPRVTLKHLLTHTSGLADYFEESELDIAEYARLWDERPNYRFRRPADFLPLFADLPRRAEPGAVVSYNNAAFILLALIAETVTSRPFIELIEREVFAPAGMGDSGYFALDEIRPRTAVGYVRGEDGTWRTNVYSIPIVGGGDGGAFATADDLVRFLAALDEGRLLSAETTRKMLSPQVRFRDGVACGHGFWLLGEGRTRSFGGTGADPGVAARALRWPELRITAVLLANVSEGDSEIWPLVLSAVENAADGEADGRVRASFAD